MVISTVYTESSASGGNTLYTAGYRTPQPAGDVISVNPLFSQPLAYAAATVSFAGTGAAFRDNQGSSFFTSTVTPTIAKQSGTVDGDILVIRVQAQDPAAQVTSGPSGFTLVGRDGCNTFSSWTYYKTAASEPASYSLTLDRATSGIVRILTVSGATSVQAAAGVSSGITPFSRFLSPYGLSCASQGLTLHMFTCMTASTGQRFTIPSAATVNESVPQIRPRKQYRRSGYHSPGRW